MILRYYLLVLDPVCPISLVSPLPLPAPFPYFLFLVSSKPLAFNTSVVLTARPQTANMHTRSALLFLLALFVRSVHTTGPNASSPDAIVKRGPENNESLHKRAALPGGPDSLTGLIEIRAPSDLDHIARSPTPVSATTEPDTDSEPELEFDPAPAPKAATKPVALQLESDSPLLEYEGAGILDKRANCPA